MEQFIDELFLNLEARGRDAAGFVAVERDGTTTLSKKAEPAHQFITLRKSLPKGTRSVLLHTRLATQGDPAKNANNHPVNYGTIFTTHNGHIRNDDEVFELLKLDRYAEVDSESIPAALYKHGFDGVKDAFELLEGGYATASVDVRHTGKVLLTKGPTYPLVIHENKKFVLWASTKDIIEKAWKDALGEPLPDTKTFRWLTEGDVMLLDNDQVTLTRNAFTPYRPSYYSTNNHHHYWDKDDDDYSWYYDDRYGVGRTQTRGRKRGVVTPPKSGEAVRELRKQGKGQAVVWENREKASAAKKQLHNNKWHYCRPCNETVMDIDTIDSTEWGKLCIDCYTWAADQRRNKATTDALTRDEIEDLEGWVKIESDIHLQAVINTADEFGLSYEAVEYLLFRVADSYLEKNKRMAKITNMVREEYKVNEGDIWDSYVDEWEEKNKQEEEENCTIVTSPCKVCETVSDAKLINCPRCKFRKDGKTYEQMTFKGKNVSKTRKCLTCGRKAKVYMGLKHQWCGKHYSACKGNEHCKGKTIATGPDGHRYCHTHYRGMKGGIQDGDRYKSTLT